MATFGAREAVARCITSLFDVDPGYPFRLTIYDNVESTKDGTRDFLKQFQSDLSDGSDPSNLNIIFAPDNMGHGHCLDYLVKHTSDLSDIIVALDSDLVFTPQAAGWLRAIVETIRGEVKICGNTAGVHRSQSGARWCMPRVLPMVMGVDRKFLQHWGLRFAPCRWRLADVPCRYPLRWTDRFGGGFPWDGTPRWFLKSDSSDRSDFDFRGDVGWQFYFILGVCGAHRLAPLPSIVVKGVLHAGHASLGRIHREERPMRKVVVHRKDSAEAVSGTIGSLKAMQGEGRCLCVHNVSIGAATYEMLFIPWSNVDRIEVSRADGLECRQVNKPEVGADVPVKEVPTQ